MAELTEQLEEQGHMAIESKPQLRTIFTSMFDVVNEKERRRLWFAKCSGCNRLNVYRLANLDETKNEIRCRKCGVKISIQNKRSFIP